MASLSAAYLVGRNAFAHEPFNPGDTPPEDPPQAGSWYDPNGVLPKPLPGLVKTAAGVSGFGVAGAGFLAGVMIAQGDTPIPGPADGIGAIVAGAAAVAGSLLVDIATDPPQSDYKKVVTPIVPVLSTFKHADALEPVDAALIEDVLGLYGRGIALIETFERQQYAAQVGDAAWVEVHQAARESLAKDLATSALALLDLAGRALELFDQAAIPPGKVLSAPSNPSTAGLSLPVPAYARHVYDEFIAFVLQRPLKVHPVDFHAAFAGLSMHQIRHQGGNAYLCMLDSVATLQVAEHWLVPL